MRTILLSLFLFITCIMNAQIFDVNSAQMVLDSQRAYLNAYGQMTQRAIQIMHAVQPYREAMYQKYKEGAYRDALEICYKTYSQYVYYKFDNRGMSDMELLAGDCAAILKNYELAILWYNNAKEAEEGNANSRLLELFNIKVSDARNSFKKNDMSKLYEDVTIALKTGWESGECYYYYGVCYENGNNLKDAKRMYKLAKKKKYNPAVDALKSMKKKK